ncbi:MAG: hypothetical protein KDA05_12635, partial [Phycisphaerales bacterium]|nr:hypothetical protein [Phycisphaerales bacterium]
MSRARSSTLPALIALAAGTAACSAQSTVGFQVTHILPNPFRGVYLVGDLPELGGGDPGAGVRMWPVAPNEYRIDVLLPPDTPYTFQFVERDTQPLLCGPPATIAITQVESAHTPPHAAPPRHKTVWAHSSIPQPILHWRQDDGAFRAVAMRDTAPGRTPGERRWGAGGFATAGREVEFYLTDEAGTLREPPSGEYRTSMDACFLQDAELFGYVPAPTVSPLRREYDPMALPTFFSTVLGEDRPYRVVLPRGYDDHPSMRYPVVYAHDGQFWFEPNLIGAPMDPDAAVFASLVREGRVAECILVALDA